MATVTTIVTAATLKRLGVDTSRQAAVIRCQILQTMSTLALSSVIMVERAVPTLW